MVRVEPRSKWVHANGLNIHYWDWEGSGPHLVMLHATTGFGRIWDFVARSLHPDYRIICPDQRGHGDTDKPRSGYAAKDYAADLAALVKELGLRKIILAGHSLGSRAGMVYAAENPDSISHLIIVAGPHYVSLFPSDTGDRELFEEQARQHESAPVRFASIDEVIQSLRIVPYYSLCSDEALQHVATYNTNRNADGSLEWKWDRGAVAQTLRQVPGDLRLSVKRISCPILIPWGKRTLDLTPERVNLVKPFFPTAHWEFIERGQYLMYLEAPEGLAKAIKEFLSKG